MPLRGDKDFLTVGVEAAMATTGYDPYLTLWQFFRGPSESKLRRFDETERRLIQNVIGEVFDFGAPASRDVLLERFSNAMRAQTGEVLSSLERPIAGGLLELMLEHGARVGNPVNPLTKHDSITLGIWDHFKGGVYKVTGFSSWASGNGEKVVGYTSMLFGTDHTRLVNQWCEVVEWPDGKYRSRFVYRGADLKVTAPSWKVPSPT